MDQWLKTSSHSRRDSDNLQYGELRSYRESIFIKFFLWIFINFTDTYKQERYSSSFSSSSFSSPTVSEIQIREREDGNNSDISPVPVSNSLDDGSGKLEEIQANKTQKQIKRKPR